MAKEYINRNSVMDRIAFCIMDDQITGVVRTKDILAIPAADVVEVVRCKDCKHRGTNDCALDTYLYDVVEDGFCSYGERRDNDGETD